MATPLDTMPGAFDATAARPFASDTFLRSSTANGSVVESLNKTLEASFVQKENATTRTALQRHMVAQLASLAYFLIGFQFLRSTHGSCLPPALAHILVQLSLHTSQMTSPAESGGRIFGEHLDAQERQFEASGLQFDRQKIVDFVVAKTRHFLYWKQIGVTIYHVLYFFLWLWPLANEGRLGRLENGSWYTISFLGESLSPQYSLEGPWWVQLWELGLFELLLLDGFIFVIQLVLYQAIFLQSTISPRGIRLNEPEDFIMRNQGAGAESSAWNKQVPEILHVKLFECLDGSF